MKNIAAIALFVVATFIAAGPAHAQDHSVKATVPFNFTVGDQTLPSGTYTIGSRTTSPDVLAMRNWDKKVNILSMGQTNQGNPGHDNTLVFHKYGNQYFLSEIRSEGTSINIHFPATKAEKRAKSLAEEARLFVDHPVLIALNWTDERLQYFGPGDSSPGLSPNYEADLRQGLSALPPHTTHLLAQ